MSLPDVSSEVTPTLNGGTIRGISYNELPDSMQFTYDETGPRGVRKFHVLWANRFNFVKAFCGDQVWRENKLVSVINAQTYPGYEQLAALKGVVKPIGRLSMSSGTLAATLAEVSIEYGKPELSATAEQKQDPKQPGQGEGERVLATEEIDFSGEWMIAPEGGFKWARYTHTINASGQWVEGNSQATDYNKVVAQQTPVFIPSIDHVYVKHGLTLIPDTTLRKCLGKVNSGVWPPAKSKRKGRVAAAAGFVLFAGARASREILASGARPYQLTIVLKERMVPWNALWNSTDRAWVKTDPVLYTSADFDELLEFTAQE